jgi:PHD/YefM family antitoxin component YafN of YafNO toxin-antitoxin module
VKRVISLVFILLLVLSLSSCASTKLAEAFDKEEVLARGKEVAALLSASDFAAVTAQVREDLREQLSENGLKDALGTYITEAGAFKEFTSSAVIGQKDKSTGEDYAVAVIRAKHENKSLTYTFYFDVNMDIVGLYMK